MNILIVYVLVLYLSKVKERFIKIKNILCTAMCIEIVIIIGNKYVFLLIIFSSKIRYFI